MRGLPLSKAYLFLGAGIIAFSWAAILVKLCDAPPLAIAAYRMGIASVILAPIFLGPHRRRLSSISRRDLLLTLASGVLLGFHFALWITSLEYTSVASSVVLVTLNPIFVALIARFTIKEKLSPQLTTCLLVAVAGALVIVVIDWDQEPRSLYGDLLALSGSLMISGVLIIGRDVRQRVDLLPYVFITYTTAAVVLLAMVLASGTPLSPFPMLTYVFFILLALGPTLLGHTSVNWALRYLPAAVIAMVILGEPVGATTIAYFLLNEVPSVWRLIGGALILIAIYFSLAEMGKSSRKNPS